MVAAALLAPLAGCAPDTPDAATERRILRINLTVSPASLDPAYARDQSMGWMVGQLYGTLVALDSQLLPVPALATAWTVSSDGRRYTFRLRRDAYFHTDACFGADSTRPLRAADVVYSWQRVAHPRTASPGQWLFSAVAGLDDYQSGRSAGLSGLSAPNDSTVVVQLSRPFPPFLTLLSMPYASVVAPEAVQTYGSALGRHPVGTGPYRLFRWDEGQQLVLHRHLRYHLPGLPRTDAVQVRLLRSRLTALQELLRGRLDWMEGLDPTLKDELFTLDGQLKPAYAGRIRLRTGPQLTTEYLGIQLDTLLNPHPAARDVRVRRALLHAVNRPKLVRYLRNNLATPALGFLPAGLPAGPALPDLAPHHLPADSSYDPARARALLAAAGYPGGRGLPPLTLVSTPAYQNISEFLQAELATVGIRLEIEHVEGAAGRERIAAGTAGLWRASWVADYPDAENFLALFYSPNRAPVGPNTTRYASEVFDRLYQAALAEPDEARRIALYRQAAAEMLTQVPVIPLFYYRTLWYTHPRLHGLRLSALDSQLPLAEAWKE